MEIKSSSQKAIIMELLKNSFGGYAMWRRIESELALMCSSIPEDINAKNKQEFLDILTRIKTYLMSEGVENEDLRFLDEEIERHKETKQISLYQEAEDQVEQEWIAKYSRVGYNTEGIVGIHLGFNYEQLKRLTNGVYEKTGLIKFYISREKTLYGKIVAEVFEHPQKIPVATLVESKKVDKETGDPFIKKIALFGEKVSLKEYVKIKEIEVPFRVYRFISEHNQDFILLTKDDLTIGDYIVTGVVTQVDDYKILTESSRLPTKLPYIFAQSVKNRIIKYKDHGEFKARLAFLNINKRNLFELPFTIKHKKTGKMVIQKHPVWFKWLVWGWLLHAKYGLENEYPMHILMIGDPGSGKSTLLNRLWARSKEARFLFSGSSSTLKNLIPSFRHSPAKLGYLAESNRFAFLDEFLRCIVRTKTTKEGSDREESVAMMNDLLEHQKREAGSGISSIKVNMTARAFATSNPVKEVHAVEDLLKAFDMSFLSRWLIYYQTSQHVNMIRNADELDLREHDYDMDDKDWVSILDYLHTFQVDMDDAKLREIHAEPLPLLSEDLLSHYKTRHKHHLKCLLDGLVKARCLFSHDMAFSAQEQDYNLCREVWSSIIRSWVDAEKIKRLPLERRQYYLPENAQYLYRKICEKKRPVNRFETEEFAEKEMSKNEYRMSYVILRDMGLIIEDDGTVRPHWMENANLELAE